MIRTKVNEMATHREYLERRLEEIAADGEPSDGVIGGSGSLLFASDEHYYTISTSLEYLKLVHKEEGMKEAFMSYLNFVKTQYMMDVFKFVVNCYKGEKMNQKDTQEINDEICRIGKELEL